MTEKLAMPDSLRQVLENAIAQNPTAVQVIWDSYGYTAPINPDTLTAAYHKDPSIAQALNEATGFDAQDQGGADHFDGVEELQGFNLSGLKDRVKTGANNFFEKAKAKDSNGRTNWDKALDFTLNTVTKAKGITEAFKRKNNADDGGLTVDPAPATKSALPKPVLYGLLAVAVLLLAVVAVKFLKKK